MVDERAYLARFESAEPDELRKMLLRPTAEEEAVLRAYLGEARFHRMRSLAMAPTTRGIAKNGNVVVLHGIMGSEISSRKNKDSDLIWLHYWRLAWGGIGRLKLDAKGIADADASLLSSATNI